MDSILTAIKKMLGIDQADTSFDQDIIILINLAIFRLNQLGIGPEMGFSITGKDEIWVDLIGDRKDLEAVKTFIYLKVRIIFDPPTSAFVMEAIKAQISELEWCLNVQAEKIEGGS